MLSASPVQLVALAYEGAITAVADARVHVKAKRIAERSKAITKAQLILMELQRSLDHQKGGDLAVQLSGLYAYMLGRLNEANFKQIEAPLAEVQKLLETVNEGWREISTPESAIAAAAPASGWQIASESIPSTRTEFSF